jgi:hypothetical protein
MSLIHTIRRQVLHLAVGLLILLLIIWYLTPSSQTFLAGMILGLLTGLYNILHLARRVRIVGEQVIASKGKKVRSGLGMINRFLLVALAVTIVGLYPQHFDYKGLIAGLPICYILPLAAAFTQTRK